MKTKAQTWSEEITAIADDKKFDWIELKPIIRKPEKLISYVPRCIIYIINTP